MDERIPCKNPQCSHFILPATAARTEGYCMPCVQARYRQEQEEYIRKNRKTIDAFSGITNPVEMLKLVHEPREHDPLIEWIPCPIPTDELYKKLSDDESRDMVDYAEELLIPDGRRKLRKLRCAWRHLPRPIWIISCAK